MATADTIRAVVTVAIGATCTRRAQPRTSTDIRWGEAPASIIITIRRLELRRITTVFLRWEPDREDTMRLHRSKRWHRVDQLVSAAPFQTDFHHVTVAIRTWATR